MKRAVDKTRTLLEALPYFQAFRRKTFVVKLGGSAMEKPDTVRSVLRDIVLLENVGIRVVVVHGGGKAISRALKKKKIPSGFRGGLRVTSKEAISVVEDVLVNEVNRHIVREIKSLGGDAVGFSAADHGVLEVKKKYHYEADDSGRRRRCDIGFVGSITGVRTHPVYRLLNVERIPVIAPLGLGPNGFVYNVNADTAACEIAARLKAEKLIFLTDVDGISDGRKLLPTLTVGEVGEHTRTGVISGGMIPKTQSMVKALKRGVRKTHIINGTVPHSLLLEIYTDTGIGTELIKKREQER